MTSPVPISPLATQRSYLADSDKEEVAYAEAWWTTRRPNRRTSSGKKSPLRGSFSSEEVPGLGGSSQFTSPSSSIPATPAEYVQESFDLAQRKRESYYKAWSSAVEQKILNVHEARDPAIKINSPPRNSNLLAAQLGAFADQRAAEDNYYQAWSGASTEHTLLAHESRHPATETASNSANSDAQSILLRLHAERREQEEAYYDAWIHAVQTGLLTSNFPSTSNTPYLLVVQKYFAERRQQEEEYDQAWCDAVKNNLIVGSGTRASATQIGWQTSNTSPLAAQLQAAKDQEAAEEAYADAWSRYSEITQYATAVDAWKAHHMDILRHEKEYYNVWASDAAKTPGFSAKASRPSATQIGLGKYEANPLAAQLAEFQDEHTRQEQYDEAWTAYTNRHHSMAPPPVLCSPRRRTTNSRRLSITRSPRPAYTKRLPVDVAAPELPMLGFSAMELVPENDGYIKSWVDKMKTTTITPANSTLFSAPTTKKRGAPHSPRPKKMKGHFTWPEGLTEEEKLGLTTRGNLQPYLSSLLGKIVSFEFIGQSEPTISPDEASPERPMQLTRRANFKCQNNTVCKIKAAVSITSPEPARRYMHNPLPLFDALRSFGHAAVVQLDEVGLGKLNQETGRQSIWRRYSVVSGAYRCEITETFVDRRMFSPEGCDFGKRVLIKNGLVMSPNGADYIALPL
ncbi:hypothetical protein FRC09_018281 [Ceratobasidium sp. 395]|nr:hypothetical protein FRC09_018281 [Ceratobasidium sp. 395]